MNLNNLYIVINQIRSFIINKINYLNINIVIKSIIN